METPPHVSRLIDLAYAWAEDATALPDLLTALADAVEARSGVVIELQASRRALVPGAVRCRPEAVASYERQFATLDPLPRAAGFNVSESRSSNHASASVLAATKPSGRRPWPVIVRPIPTLLPVQRGARVTAVVHVADTDDVPAPSSRLLRELHQLTPAEARVAALMARGANSSEIAAELGYAPTSAAWYGKRVLAKTGAPGGALRRPCIDGLGHRTGAGMSISVRQEVWRQPDSSPIALRITARARDLSTLSSKRTNDTSRSGGDSRRLESSESRPHPISQGGRNGQSRNVSSRCTGPCARRELHRQRFAEGR